MLSSTIILTTVIVLLALGFDFINGFHDTANSIATSVSTKVLTMREAVVMAASLNFLGAFISTNVAKTVGADLVSPGKGMELVIVAALIGAIIWNLITWYIGLPSSSSHALIGGLIGAAIVYKGTLSVVNWWNFWDKVVLWLFLSPVIGFIMGYIFMTLINWLLRKTKPASVTKIFSKAQIASAALMALNHGANDAQKSMGIIAMALFSAKVLHGSFYVPIWVKAACAIAMAIGTSLGGWRIIKTVGLKMAHLAPVNGFAAETGAAAVIFTATMLDAPVSTTHIISTSIMGVAASKRLSSVRWGVAKNIVWAWVVTIPLCALVSAGVMWILKLFI